MEAVEGMPIDLTQKKIVGLNVKIPVLCQIMLVTRFVLLTFNDGGTTLLQNSVNLLSMVGVQEQEITF